MNMNKIVLPPLPDPRPHAFLPHEVLARDLEVARVVLEAAAKACEHWSKQNWVYVNGAIQCEKVIRALEFRHE